MSSVSVKSATFSFQLQFMIFHGHVSNAPFQNKSTVSFCISGLLSFQRFVFEKAAITAKWFLRFFKHGKALGGARVSGPGC